MRKLLNYLVFLCFLIGSNSAFSVSCYNASGNSYDCNVLLDPATGNRFGSTNPMPVSATITPVADVTASGNISALNANLSSGAATANSTVATDTLSSISTVNVLVTGTFSQTLLFQISTDGSNWTSLPQITNLANSTVAANVTGTGNYQVSIPASAKFRVTSSVYTSGTATISIRASSGISTSLLPLETGGNLDLIATNTLGLNNAVGTAAAGTAGNKSLLGGGVYNSSAPALTNGQQAALQFDSSGNLKINSAAGSAVAQGSTTSGQVGNLVQGAVTTAAPSYTNAQTSPLSLTTAGGLRVDGSAVTQPVSAASLPLPSGAATSAKQDTEIASLATIATNTTGASTAANQTTANTSLSTIATNTTGASTAANQTSIQANAGSDASKAVAVQGVSGGKPVPSTITNGTQAADTVAGNVAGQNAVLTAGNSFYQTGQTTTGAVTTTPIDTTNLKFITLQITAISGNTLTFQESVDGTNYTSKVMYPAGAANNNAALSSATTGIWVAPLHGKFFRLSASGGSSTYHILATSEANPLHSMQLMAVQSGTWTVQPGNTANTTAWKVDGSAVTQPVSGTVTSNPTASTTGGGSFANMTTSTTTTIKTGAGTFYGIWINTRGTGSAAQCYDNTAASGTKVTGSIDTTLSTTPFEAGPYGVAFSTGLTCITSGASPADIGIYYK